MYEHKKIILLAALFSTGSPWVLNFTHTNVVPKLTNDVKLQCLCKNSENSKRKMNLLMRIRILKQNDAGNWMTFAEISQPNKSSVRLSQCCTGIVASGHLGTPGESFLSVTWPTAYDDTAGSYQCEVDGFGDDFRSDIHLSTQTVNITSFLPTTMDLVDIMVNMTHEIQSTVEDNFLEVRYWPEGNYTLLSPVSGCPDTTFTQMVRGFVKITTERNHKPNNSLSSPSHLHSDVFDRCDNHNIFHFKFCRNPIPDNQVVPWPKGSCCIYYWQHPCPPGFRGGRIDAYLESSSDLVYTRENVMDTIHTRSEVAYFHFCCREDGDPNVPVLHPTYKPFYLNRYKGKCQRMCQRKWIHLDSLIKDTYDAFIPDIKLIDCTFRLCYYTKQKRR